MLYISGADYGVDSFEATSYVKEADVWCPNQSNMGKNICLYYVEWSEKQHIYTL